MTPSSSLVLGLLYKCSLPRSSFANKLYLPHSSKHERYPRPRPLASPPQKPPLSVFARKQKGLPPSLQAMLQEFQSGYLWVAPKAWDGHTLVAGSTQNHQHHCAFVLVWFEGRLLKGELQKKKKRKRKATRPLWPCAMTRPD